jgi:hypothetical protein
VITGVDISKYQPTFAPRAKDSFVVVKASEGSTVRNAYHDTQVARARAAGKICGHYHWLHRGNIADQVANFAREAKVQQGDIIALDWEEPSPLVPVADEVAWVKAARVRFPNNRIVVYTYPYYQPFRDGYRQADWADGLWIADYRTGTTPRDIFNLPWVIHQYTTNSGTLDENRARFDTQAAMQAWARGLEEGAIKAPYPTTSGNPGLICSCVRDALPLVEYRFAQRGWIQQDFSGLVTQWGYKNNDVDASSTTHNGGGVLDVRWTLVDTDAKLKVWQECGFAPFRRRPPQWSLTVHGHICVIGCDHIDPLAAWQVADYRNGENGLGGAANHTPYDGPIYVKRTWQDAQRVYAELIEEMNMPTAADVWDKDLTLGPGVHSAGWYIREIHKLTKAANARTMVLADATELILAKLAADDPGEAQLQADLAAIRAELEALNAEEELPEAAEGEDVGPADPYAPPHETDPK